MSAGRMMTRLLVLFALGGSGVAGAQTKLVAKATTVDPRTLGPDAKEWATAAPAELALMAQPMVTPRPAAAKTTAVKVEALHDGGSIAFRLRWADTEVSEAGRLGEFSDAVALQFPVKSNSTPPPVFMGGAGDPVHIFHWRAQYQRDLERGKPTMKALYPNMTVDYYPMEPKDAGKLGKRPEGAAETFSPAVALGNPQAYAKHGVDELIAEGFGTSAVQQGTGSSSRARWQNGEWSVVIVRPLGCAGGSRLTVGQSSFIAAAVWQGGQSEVGSRKAVTMVWTPLLVEGKEAAK